MKENIVRLDVRTPEEYAHGHIDGFQNIPVDELRERLNEIDTDKPILCNLSERTAKLYSSRILSGKGLSAIILPEDFVFMMR